MKKFQVIRVKNHGDDWVNRLAVIEDQIARMGRAERDVTLDWLIARYATE